MATAHFKQLGRSCGFDQIALVPEGVTVSIPILVSVTDAVTDVNFAPTRFDHLRAAFAVNSGPLSGRMCSGTPLTRNN